VARHLGTTPDMHIAARDRETPNGAQSMDFQPFLQQHSYSHF
jgi:hypothetical protein